MILHGAGWFSSRALRGAFGGVCGDSERVVRSKQLLLACVVGALAIACAMLVL